MLDLSRCVWPEPIHQPGTKSYFLGISIALSEVLTMIGLDHFFVQEPGGPDNITGLGDHIVFVYPEDLGCHTAYVHVDVSRCLKGLKNFVDIIWQSSVCDLLAEPAVLVGMPPIDHQRFGAQLTKSIST